MPLTLLAILLLLIGAATGMKYIQHASLLQASGLAIASVSQRILATGYASGMNRSQLVSFADYFSKQSNFSVGFLRPNDTGMCPGEICRIVTVSGKSYVMVLK